jgi:hypothetical protein
LSPVAAIFSASWSTPTLLGAHTSTWLPAVVHRWYTMVALVTVLPVPGGPCGEGKCECGWGRQAGRQEVRG